MEFNGFALIMLLPLPLIHFPSISCNILLNSKSTSDIYVVSSWDFMFIKAFPGEEGEFSINNSFYILQQLFLN